MPVISALSPVSLSSYFDPNTGAALHVDLYFYKAGTLDPIPVYADANLSVTHTQPLPSTGYARVPPVFVGELPDPGYRVRVFNQYSELVEDIDNLPGAVVPDGGGGGEGPVQPDDVHLLKTGEYIFAARNATPREGAVLANGLTIGSATSSATGRANADAHDLFVLLWGSDEYGLLPVLPSRGVSAEGDWLANKSITLPDLQCAMLIGMDAMGAAATNRLNGVPMAGVAHQPARAFSRGGAALVTLTTAMMPAHAHTINENAHTHSVAIPGHTHALSNGLAASAGSHTHTGTTDSQGAHTHSYLYAPAQPNFGGGGGESGGTPTANTTGSAGAHTHAVTTDAAGAHTHAVTMDIAAYAGATIDSGPASTGLSLNNSGGDGAHNNTPLFVTCSIYLVL